MCNLASSYHGDVMLNLLKMNEFKGTKGKWYVGASRDVKNLETRKVIADCNFFGDNKEVEIANAQLIAHAPEMLESLIKVNNFIIENKDRNYMIELLAREVPELSDLITRATTIQNEK